MKKIKMNKMLFVFFTLTLMLSFYSCSKSWTSDKAILTEDAVQNFIKHHTELNKELLSSHKEIKPFIRMSDFTPKKALTNLQNIPTPEILKNLFKKYGLNGNKAVLQITVMQYGIVAYTMDETLEEIKKSGEERNKKQKASDIAVANYAKKLKTLINTDDYKLIKKYHKELFEVFNNFKGWNETD